MASSVRLSIELEPELKQWLEDEAKRQDSSAGDVAAQAIAAQKARSEGRRRMIEKAVIEADKGEFISAERMNAWFLSLGTDNELPEPGVDVALRYRPAMRLLFLPQAKNDLRWFKRYYTEAFPEGRTKADAQFLRTQQLLLTNPHIGHPSENVESARELHIQRTPFTVIYRPFGDRIEILRVVDERSDWMAPLV